MASIVVALEILHCVKCASRDEKTYFDICLSSKYEYFIYYLKKQPVQFQCY